jgi:hypothetical protein
MLIQTSSDPINSLETPRSLYAKQLTNILASVVLNNISEFHIPSNDSHLVRCLIGKVESISVRSTKEEEASTRFLIVHSADMKRSVP